MSITSTISHCANCDSILPLDARFCSNCGKPISVDNDAYIENSPMIGFAYSTPSNLTQHERNQASFCHLATLLGWIIPFGDLILTFIVWNTYRGSSEFINNHGKEAVNYQISFYIWTMIFGLLACIWIGIPFLIILAIIDITIPIIAAVKASKGEIYRYPLIFRFIK